MSLVVSLRIPDGIVVAADSLSTSQSILDIKAVGQDGKEVPIQQFSIPFSASSYTQKVFSLFKNYAFTSFALGIINQRSIHYHIKQFEKLYPKSNENLEKVKNAIIRYFENELLEQMPDYKTKVPKGQCLLGFQLSGYEDVNNKQVGTTYEVFLGGPDIVENRFDIIGCRFNGDLRFINTFAEIGNKINFGFFTLQDAIDFCNFIIQTTATFQRFAIATGVPTVGGDIDIALVTPFNGFQWIKRKKIMEILEQNDGK